MPLVRVALVDGVFTEERQAVPRSVDVMGALGRAEQAYDAIDGHPDAGDADL